MTQNNSNSNTNSLATQSSVALVEAYYWRTGKVPETDDDIFREFMELSDIDSVLTNAKAVAYLVEQGVPLVNKLGLTVKMMRWIEVLCAVDNLPLGMKMKSAKVTPSEHSRYMRNQLFCRVLRDETSKILPNNQVHIHNALTREANKGNIQAIRLLMEITGEYTPRSTSEVGTKHEVKNLMNGVLEILQSHVDVKTLEQVAEDFEYLLVNGRPPAPSFKPSAINAPASISATSLMGEDDLIELEDELGRV